MKKQIKKSKAFGKVVVPPSKSYSHRLLIASALSNRPCTIQNVECSNDIATTIDALTMLGADISYHQQEVKIHQTIFTNPQMKNDISQELTINCHESGSTLRFLIPLGLVLTKNVTFTGTKTLMQRGLDVYEAIFKEQNINYQKDENSIHIFGNLKPGHYQVKANISSQFISGLLFSLPLLEEDSVIEMIPPIESKNYLDITLDVLKMFGIQITCQDQCYYIRGKQRYQGIDSRVEGDYSNAAFLDALNYYGGHVELLGLNPHSLQGDQIYQTYFKELSKGSKVIDLSNAIDLGPILFAFASSHHGAHFINTHRLKIKESNRVDALIQELEKMGAKIKVLDNEVIIYETKLHTPTEVLDGHNDHRIVMSLAVLATSFGGIIESSEAVAKSYPSFFDVIKQLGIEVEDVK